MNIGEGGQPRGGQRGVEVALETETRAMKLLQMLAGYRGFRLQRELWFALTGDRPMNEWWARRLLLRDCYDKA